MKKLFLNLIRIVKCWYIGKSVYIPDLGSPYDHTYRIGTGNVIYSQHWTSKRLHQLIFLLKKYHSELLQILLVITPPIIYSLN